jgi:ferredoxin
MLSRKQFFKQCAASLGKAILEVSDVISPAGAQVNSAAREQPLPREPDGHLVATTRNRYCQARGNSCVTCIERCKADAIQLVPGEGIRIDPALCIGCGTCEKLCPAAPKAVQLRDRSSYDETTVKK